MIVLDASAAVDWLLQTVPGQRIEQRIYARADTLHSVYLLDVEFVQVMRRLVREGKLTPKRAGEAIQDMADLRITRYAPVPYLIADFRTATTVAGVVGDSRLQRRSVPVAQPHAHHAARLKIHRRGNHRRPQQWVDWAEVRVCNIDRSNVPRHLPYANVK